MAKLLKLRRGTDTQHSTFTGAAGEVTVNTTNDSLHVHDGTTAGGTELAKADLSNVDGSLSNNLGFADNVEARFGTGGDLRLSHDGTNSSITNNTGHLYIRNNFDDDDGGNVYIQAKNGENGIVVQDDSSVNLFYDNSEKLATTSSGISVTGNIDLADNNSLRLGSSADLSIYHDGANSFITDTGTCLLYTSPSPRD